MALKINDNYYKIASHRFNGTDLIVTCDIYSNEQARIAEKKYLQDVLNFKIKAEQLLDKISDDIKSKIESENILTEEQLKFSGVYKETVMFDDMQNELNYILQYIFAQERLVPNINFSEVWKTCGFNENFLSVPFKKIGGIEINAGEVNNMALTINELYEIIKPKFISFVDC